MNEWMNEWMNELINVFYVNNKSEKKILVKHCYEKILIIANVHNISCIIVYMTCNNEAHNDFYR